MDTCRKKSQGPTITANTITTTHRTVRRILPRGLRSLLARHDSPLRNPTRTPGDEFGLCLPLAEPPERPTIVATHLHDFNKPTNEAAITTASLAPTTENPTRRAIFAHTASTRHGTNQYAARRGDVATMYEPFVHWFVHLGLPTFSAGRRFVSRRASMLRP